MKIKIEKKYQETHLRRKIKSPKYTISPQEAIFNLGVRNENFKIWGLVTVIKKKKKQRKRLN